jgi:hypothetical protein
MSIFGWFGAHAVKNSQLAWGARAIFKPSDVAPLDILGDRQGHSIDGKLWSDSNNDEDKVRWEEFSAVLNESVLPELQKISKDFCTSSTERFSRQFHWKHDDKLVLVAVGSPNGSYGYFYLSVSLVKMEDAPEDILSESEQYRIRQKEQDCEYAAEKERLRPIIAKHNREEREKTNTIRSQVEDRIDGRYPCEHGKPLESGDYIQIDCNQAYRDGFVLAVNKSEGKALIEYFMPNGRKFMRVIEVADHDQGKPVSESKLPKKWQRLIA